MRLCTSDQMRQIDRTTIDNFGIAARVLMEAAGKAVADIICQYRTVRNTRVVVLCGIGNNGGDGFVAARYLKDRGALVTVAVVGERSKIATDARANLSVLEKIGCPSNALQSDADWQVLLPQLEAPHIIIDAIVGTGGSGPLKPAAARAITWANQQSALRVAIDVPSGLNADTGERHDVVFAADQTVTLGLPKVGLVSFPGAQWVGQLHVADIGIPSAALASAATCGDWIDREVVNALIVPVSQWGHKGTNGHLLAVAGSPGKSGAAALCGEAALRTGTGLCTVATAPEVAAEIGRHCRELMTASMLMSSEQLLSNKSAVALGPGLMAGDKGRDWLRTFLPHCAVPMVIDADGLNHLAEDLSLLRQSQAAVIVTPHPGEMARLINTTSSVVQANRVVIATQFAAKQGVYVVLKGARTVIAAPDGRMAINSTGNGGLSRAGTGDVLTGMLGSLLAQRYDPWAAAVLGVYLHGLAGDRAAERCSSRSMLASDVMSEIGAAFRTLDTTY